jgi:hypothetical protein
MISLSSASVAFVCAMAGGAQIPTNPIERIRRLDRFILSSQRAVEPRSRPAAIRLLPPSIGIKLVTHRRDGMSRFGLRCSADELEPIALTLSVALFGD